MPVPTYVSPTWYNDAAPAIDAAKMQAITDTIADNQSRIGTAENDIDTIEGHIINLGNRMDIAENDIDTLQVQVAAIGDGSPKGVFPNLAALQAAFPTGAQGIYVVLDTGHWYYWNGTAWADGGQYKADITIMQTTGQSTVNVMSQKAVTDELNAINTEIDSYGFSVVNGKLCVTYNI